MTIFKLRLGTYLYKPWLTVVVTFFFLSLKDFTDGVTLTYSDAISLGFIIELFKLDCWDFLSSLFLKGILRDDTRP